MRKCVVLVDNSNLFIGGQQCSAEHGGHHGGGNGHHPPSDSKWRIRYESLLPCLADGREVEAAIMVGSGPEDRGPWDAARDSGFEVIVYGREGGHGEKCIDTELVVRGTEILATAPEPMDLVIASGDRDFLPLVEAAHRHGWQVELCAFTNSYPPDGDLAQSVDRVRPLDDLLSCIGYRED